MKIFRNEFSSPPCLICLRQIPAPLKVIDQAFTSVKSEISDGTPVRSGGPQ